MTTDIEYPWLTGNDIANFYERQSFVRSHYRKMVRTFVARGIDAILRAQTRWSFHIALP